MKNIFLLLFSAIAFNLHAQTSSVTAADYAHAANFLWFNTNALIDNDVESMHWLSGNKLWYRKLTAQGSEFVMIDAAKGTRSQPFDAQKMATALSSATGKTYTAGMLPFHDIIYLPGNKSIIVTANEKQWKVDVSNYQIVADETNIDSLQHSPNDNEVLSPDSMKAAFIKDYNLWVRDLATNKETQLTTDGEKNFGYATDNAGWKHSDDAILRWSPDSKKIATFKQDERKAGDMYLVSTNVGHPHLEAWKYPLPGDTNIITIQRVIINVDEPKIIFLKVPPDPHRATLSDDVASSGTFDDVDWSADGKQLAFVSTSRDHKQEKFRIADTETGDVREVFEENVATQYESGQGTINWKYLPASNEIIWYSERDNWGHLYLYDASTGKLKNQITKGNFVVTQLLKVDEKKRTVYFIADGKEAGNPYYSYFCKADLDGKNSTLLTPDKGNHEISLSPSKDYFIDTWSQPDAPQVTQLRSIDGKLITTLEKTDITRLKTSGWQPPVSFSVKAHVDTTDIYGLLFKPTHLDASKKYPVVDYIYPGPQGGSVGSWSFNSTYGDFQALAELGFIVVLIEGTSNPLRSKSYHDMSYGNMAENTLPDQVSGIQQLAQRYSYMDISKVGIYGHSGGGFATACAMFKYPDFFKVGISESGNHDNRNYEDDWGERYIGLLKDSGDTNNYEAQANQVYAKNLKGKLMLAHGLMDDNVPPYNTMLVIDALEKANKDYDLVVFPNAHHGYGYLSGYMTRRRWDYFVQNLAGKTPPKEFAIPYKPDERNNVE